MSGLASRVNSLGGEPPSMRAPCASGTQSGRRSHLPVRSVLFACHRHAAPGAAAEKVARDSVTGGVREQPSSPKQPFCGRVPPIPSVSYAECTPFSPWMRKGGKRIRWAGILTRQAKSSCKQACGCISKAVRADASSLLDSVVERIKFALRPFTREKSLLIEVASSRLGSGHCPPREKSPLIDAAISRIACGGSPPRLSLGGKFLGIVLIFRRVS